MKPETAREKIMNETFVQIIHLPNNSERTVYQRTCIKQQLICHTHQDVMAPWCNSRKEQATVPPK